MDEDVVCPFCGERGFDLYGLKIHLEGTLLAEPCTEFMACGEKDKDDGEKNQAVPEL